MLLWIWKWIRLLFAVLISVQLCLPWDSLWVLQLLAWSCRKNNSMKKELTIFLFFFLVVEVLFSGCWCRFEGWRKWMATGVALCLLPWHVTRNTFVLLFDYSLINPSDKLNFNLLPPHPQSKLKFLADDFDCDKLFVIILRKHPSTHSARVFFSRQGTRQWTFIRVFDHKKRHSVSEILLLLFCRCMRDSLHASNASWILLFTNFSKTLPKILTQAEWSCSRQLDVFSCKSWSRGRATLVEVAVPRNLNTQLYYCV